MTAKDHALGHVDALIRRGQALRDRSAAAPEPPASGAVRVWLNDCAAAINELSGGSKAHWLSRAYSAAFLVPSTGGGVVVEAPAGEIVGRIVDVLAQARSALAAADETAVAAAPPAPRRFDFVADAALRPVLEQAYADAGLAYDAGEHRRAFVTWCGMLEAILTDALQRHEVRGGQTPSDPGRIAALSFDARIREAEAAGLVRGGCSRLPAAARAYRDDDSAVVSPREAAIVRQVLHVVMRDLDPGR